MSDKLFPHFLLLLIVYDIFAIKRNPQTTRKSLGKALISPTHSCALCKTQNNYKIGGKLSFFEMSRFPTRFQLQFTLHHVSCRPRWRLDLKYWKLFFAFSHRKTIFRKMFSWEFHKSIIQIPSMFFTLLKSAEIKLNFMACYDKFFHSSSPTLLLCFISALQSSPHSRWFRFDFSLSWE